MVFSSLEFIYLFLFPTLGVFIVLRHLKWEKGIIYWLILTSLIFYAWWSVSYLTLLLLSVIINFGFHKLLLIYHSRTILTLATVMNLATLAYYKYADFLIDNINNLAHTQFPMLNVILPLAISFFTFQQISFLFDTYHNKISQCDFAKYCLFVVFFPQLIAGPIVLQKHTIPQFNLSVFTKPLFMNLAVGGTLFAIGLFKKIVLADSMAPTANDVFDLALTGNAVPFEAAWLGIFAYTFQIYFDFSGYCDMALGLARMFSITLPINFNSPYHATSIVDFWRRWHITLSGFLRDYLYIPLGGSRSGKVRQYASLTITMLLGGLWHGASWTFVFWGLLHGIYLTINHGWSALTKNVVLPDYIPAFLPKLLSQLLTFLVVMIAWVFFRAESFDAALSILEGMSGQTDFYTYKMWGGVLSQGSTLWWQIVALLIVVFYLPNSIVLTQKYSPVLKFPKAMKNDSLTTFLRGKLIWNPNKTWSTAALVMISSSLYYLYSSNNITEFIYFNF